MLLGMIDVATPALHVLTAAEVQAKAGAGL